VGWPAEISVADVVAVAAVGVTVVAVVVAAVAEGGDGCVAAGADAGADAVAGHPSVDRSRRRVRASICTSLRCNRQDCNRSTYEQQRHGVIDNILFLVTKWERIR